MVRADVADLRKAYISKIPLNGNTLNYPKALREPGFFENATPSINFSCRTHFSCSAEMNFIISISSSLVRLEVG